MNGEFIQPLRAGGKLKVTSSSWIKQREIFVSDSIKKGELRIEAIRKQKDYEDSIQKVINHQNAINDI